MCHLILLLPILALALFWVWPISVAAPLYALIVVLSAWVYYLLMRAMHRPVMIGKDSTLHSTGEVVDAQEHHLRVRVHSEIWQAESADLLQKGDWVKVVGMEGLTLKVQRLSNEEHLEPKTA